MNDLVSVGGICFVAVEPEKVNADPIGPIGKSAETGAETREAGTGKRKYRPRGERTRKEQQRDAAKGYRLEHMDKVREYQRKYRERKKLENEALQRKP